MRSIPATRGALLGVALSVLSASAADAATGRATAARGVSTTATTTSTPAAENTPLHLGSSGIARAASGSGDGASIVRTIVALAIVIAVIYGLARILRAIKGRSTAPSASGSGLTQLATLPLAPGRSLALVRSGRDIVLVGVGDHGVTPIKTYTEAEAIAVGIDVPQETAPELDQAERPPVGRLIDGLRRLTVR